MRDALCQVDAWDGEVLARGHSGRCRETRNIQAGSCLIRACYDWGTGTGATHKAWRRLRHVPAKAERFAHTPFAVLTPQFRLIVKLHLGGRENRLFHATIDHQVALIIERGVVLIEQDGGLPDDILGRNGSTRGTNNIRAS